jgi:hypothetical protein
MMNFQIIKNQEDLLVSIFNQSLHKLDQRLRIHLIFVYHEPDLALISSPGNQIDSFASGVKHNCWCFTTGSITTSMVAFITQSRLIAPLDLRLFFFSSFSNLWVLFFQPGVYSFRILPVCFPQRSLRGKPLSFQVFAYSSNRHIYRPKLLDQLLNCKARPQSEGQFQLVGAFIFHCFLQLFLLLRCQCPVTAKGEAPLFDLNSLFTAIKAGFVPFAGRR